MGVGWGVHLWGRGGRSQEIQQRAEDLANEEQANKKVPRGAERVCVTGEEAPYKEDATRGGTCTRGRGCGPAHRQLCPGHRRERPGKLQGKSQG